MISVVDLVDLRQDHVVVQLVGSHEQENVWLDFICFKFK